MKFPHPQICATLFALLFATSSSPGQSTSRVSINSLGEQANFGVDAPSLSADGRFVAFASESSNLVSNDTNNLMDVFVHDREAGVTTRINFRHDGDQTTFACSAPSISGDGRFVAFASADPGIISSDSNGVTDVFVHDRQLGTTTIASVSSAGVQGNDGSYTASISDDGRFVSFESYADNLISGDTNGVRDVFVRDRQTGATICASVSTSGVIGDSSSSEPTISGNGLFVAFKSSATNLVSGDTNSRTDIFVYDCETGQTGRVSISSTGEEGSRTSEYPAISADGRFVSFTSHSSEFVVPDNNSGSDIFIHDRQTNITERANESSSGYQPGGSCAYSSLSEDGRHVALSSYSMELVPGDTEWRYPDIFVKDRETGVVERVSVSSTGIEGNKYSDYPSISADGRLVAFLSTGSNLVENDTNSNSDNFVHDRWDGNGANSIYLSGPTDVPVGSSFTLEWQSTRGGSIYRLAYSLNLNSVVAWGHEFDIGAPFTLLKYGIHSPNGQANFVSSSVPSNLAGKTLYFEVGAKDLFGSLYDSNAWAINFY